MSEPTRIISRNELDHMSCGISGCDCTPLTTGMPFYIHAKCHMDDPTWVSYQDGKLLVECSVCHEPIVTIALADA